MTADNRAIQPVSGPALWSYADECLEALQAHLRANNEEQNAIAEMEAIISGYERQYGMSTFTFLRRLMADEIEDCFDFNVWGMIASELGYDAPLRPVTAPIEPNAADDAIIEAPETEAVIPTSHGRAGDIEPIAVESDSDAPSELEAVSPEIEALATMPSDDAPKRDINAVMPSALRRGVGDIAPAFSRPTRPPGLTKLRGEIWDWIEARADGHAAKNLTVDAVQSGTKRARRTCAEVLAMFRHWPDEMTRESA